MKDGDTKVDRIVNPQHAGFIVTVCLPLLAICVFAFVQMHRSSLPPGPYSAIFFLWPLLVPVAFYLARRRTTFTAALAVLIPIEILCAFIGWYTLIGLDGFWILLLVWANIIAAGVYFVQHRFAFVMSWILLAFIALAVVPLQAVLGLRLLRLHSEASRIVAYAYDYKLRTGAFPEDLRNFSFRYPALQNNFAFYGRVPGDKFTNPFQPTRNKEDEDKFSFRYHVSSQNTGYWFSSIKGWFVEDD